MIARHAGEQRVDRVGTQVLLDHHPVACRCWHSQRGAVTSTWAQLAAEDVGTAARSGQLLAPPGVAPMSAGGLRLRPPPMRGAWWPDVAPPPGSSDVREPT